MSNFKFDQLGFTINGQDSFMVSGEFHYFRVPCEDWRTRMELFKEAGGNCIATYVPWLIHEPQEGNILFGDIPQRDLARFLQTAHEAGLNVVLRPGPYQYSELLNDGLPTWLVTDYPQLLARDVHQQPFRESSISYLHPMLLEKARKYYRAFAEVARPYMAENGGPVVMLQVDNELAGIHTWFGSLDYNAETMGLGQPDGRYPRYLARIYGTIEQLNAMYGTAFTRFAEVMPVDQKDHRDMGICRRMRDYYNFYCETLSEYMLLLTSWLREDGLHEPICHNSGNPNMNAMFTDAVSRMGGSFLLGSDHYYALNQSADQNNPTPQLAIKNFESLELLRLMGMPPSVLEMPGGSPADTPPILKEDLLAHYRMNLAMGMKGVNYYVYTGGPNLPNTGNTADIYDYNALVHADGTPNETYESAKNFGLMLASHAWMQRTQRDSGVQVGFEWDTMRCNAYDWQGQTVSGTRNHEFLRKGILYTLMCGKYAPCLADIARNIALDKPLIVPCGSSMSVQAQKKLIEYAENGGHLLLFGTLPEFDLEYQPATLLREALGAPMIDSVPAKGMSRMSVAGFGDVYSCLQECYELKTLPEGTTLLAHDPITGRMFGFERNFGAGTVCWIGMTWEMRTFDQAAMLESLLARCDTRPSVESSNRNIFTALWQDEAGHATVFAMNLYSGRQKTCLTVYAQNGTVDLGELSLNPMEVRVIDL